MGSCYSSTRKYSPDGSGGPPTASSSADDPHATSSVFVLPAEEDIFTHLAAGRRTSGDSISLLACGGDGSCYLYQNVVGRSSARRCAWTKSFRAAAKPGYAVNRGLFLEPSSSSSGGAFATADATGAVRLWDDNGAALSDSPLVQHQMSVTGVDYTSDYFASGSRDCVVKVTDRTTQRLLFHKKIYAVTK